MTLLALASVGIAASSPVWAARGWSAPNIRPDLQQPVEQQTPGGATQPDRSLWVTNPTGCAWDADDRIDFTVSGSHLPAGASTSMTVCIIGDWAGHLIGVRATPELAVTVSIDGVVTVPLRGDRACLIGPDYDHDYPAFEPVAGSNGGIGVPHTVTVTATNVRPKGQLRQAGVTAIISLDYSGSRASWCPGPLVDGGVWPGPQWKVSQ